MERKIKYIEVPYFEKGQEKKLEIEVKFVPNFVNVEIAKITMDIYKIKKLFSDRLDALSEISALKTNEKPDKNKIKLLETKMKELEKEMFDFGKTDFFKRRMEIIKEILESNGIEDEKFLSEKFWYKNVDADDLNKFLEDVGNKDYEDKKKVVM